MKLTILGSGTVVPNGQRNSAGFFIETSDVKMMLDCGAGTVHALARYAIDWQALTHIFLSHFHVDHIGELASLFFAFRYAMTKERFEPLTLIAPQGADRIINHLKAAFGENIFTLKFPLHLSMVEPGASLEIGKESQLAVVKTPHTAESLAVKMSHRGQSICYTGDTDFSDSLIPFFQATDLLISECSFVERKDGVRHLAIPDVGRLAEAARVKRLVVTHLYFTMPEDDLRHRLQKIYSGEIFIGEDGLIIEV